MGDFEIFVVVCYSIILSWLVYGYVKFKKEKKLCYVTDDLAINIILSRIKDSPNQHFVEIENDIGESIRIGDIIKSDDGFTRIRITRNDILNQS